MWMTTPPAAVSTRPGRLWKTTNPFSETEQVPAWRRTAYATRVLSFLTATPRMTVILIVEDDVLANEYLEFILQQAGYEVLSATSADEAAGLLGGREDVEVIVTDINLPGSTNGLKLAAAAKTKRPKVNIIIVTGYAAPTNDEIPSGSLFIPKPYNARKIIEAVRHFQ
jgi:CheY-like chemotaxis protein